jgi:hypothetical protein
MHSKDDILIKQVAKNLDQEFSYHVNLLKNETLFADFLQNYFLGLTPTGKNDFNFISSILKTG